MGSRTSVSHEWSAPDARLRVLSVAGWAAPPPELPAAVTSGLGRAVALGFGISAVVLVLVEGSVGATLALFSALVFRW